MDVQMDPVGPRADEVPAVEGFTLEYLYGGQVVVLTLTSIDFAAVDAWVETAVRIVSSHAPGELHLSVHDISARGLTFTPYVRRKVQYMITNYPKLAGRTAAVVPSGTTGTVVRLFLNQIAKVIRGRPIRAFDTREEAIRWVAELLPPEEQAAP